METSMGAYGGFQPYCAAVLRSENHIADDMFFCRKTTGMIGIDRNVELSATSWPRSDSPARRMDPWVATLCCCAKLS